MQKFEHLFKVNEEHGSFYLQSKVSVKAALAPGGWQHLWAVFGKGQMTCTCTCNAPQRCHPHDCAANLLAF